jgi:hypothetical protein
MLLETIQPFFWQGPARANFRQLPFVFFLAKMRVLFEACNDSFYPPTI